MWAAPACMQPPRRPGGGARGPPAATTPRRGGRQARGAAQRGRGARPPRRAGRARRRPRAAAARAARRAPRPRPSPLRTIIATSFHRWGMPLGLAFGSAAAAAGGSALALLLACAPATPLLSAPCGSSMSVFTRVDGASEPSEGGRALQISPRRGRGPHAGRCPGFNCADRPFWGRARVQGAPPARCSMLQAPSRGAPLAGRCLIGVCRTAAGGCGGACL
jgi:hypothetical protein